MPTPPKKTFRNVVFFTSTHPTIRKLKKESIPSIHGNKVWNSSFALMDFLQKKAKLQNNQVLEIGCGWGVMSVFLAKKLDCQVLATDADDSVFPYLDVIAQANKVKILTKQMPYKAVKKDILKNIDVMVGSDICFWDKLTEELDQLLKRAKKNGVKKIAIADPGRPTFKELASRAEKRWPEHTEIHYHFIQKHWAEILFIDFSKEG